MSEENEVGRRGEQTTKGGQYLLDGKRGLKENL